MDAFGSLVKIYLGIMVHIRLRSRRWDMRGILGNNEDVLEMNQDGLMVLEKIWFAMILEINRDGLTVLMIRSAMMSGNSPDIRGIAKGE
ncbi:hypothetical protein YC2023_083444 [Brassica napus]